MEDYGLALKKLRKHFSLTQREVAERVGISNHAISKWENGINQPDLSSLRTICNGYGITVEDFFRIAAGEEVEDVLKETPAQNEELAITQSPAPQTEEKPNLDGAGTNQTLAFAPNFPWKWLLISLFAVAAVIIIAVAGFSSKGDTLPPESNIQSGQNIQPPEKPTQSNQNSQVQNSQTPESPDGTETGGGTVRLEYYLNGELLATQTLKKGESVMPKHAGKYGYVFTGWYTAEEGGDAFDFSSVNSSQKLYARFRPARFTVVFQDEYSDVTHELSLEYGEEWVFPQEIFTRENYTLRGWKTSDGTFYEAGANGVDLKIKDGEKGYVTAVWGLTTAYGQPYDVQFNPSCSGNFQGAMAWRTERMGTPWVLPECGYTRYGYVFTRWKINGKSYAPGDTFDYVEDAQGEYCLLTVYAVWEEACYTVECRSPLHEETYTHVYYYNDKIYMGNVLYYDFDAPEGYELVGYEINGVTYARSQAVKQLSGIKGATVIVNAVWEKTS